MLEFKYAFFGYSDDGKFTHACRRPNCYYDIHNQPVKAIVPFNNNQIQYFLNLDKPTAPITIRFIDIIKKVIRERL